MTVAVVIPYYQRERGILARALKSVLEQESVQPAIIVVDDSSPRSAGDEIRECLPEADQVVTVIHQPNGGPAAARNTGLDHVPPGTEYVAFLDSDDQWSAGHLRNALTALKAGYDFYFTNWLDLDRDVGEFNRRHFTRARGHRDEAIAGADDTFCFHGDMFDQLLREHVIETSTVVFRRAAAPGLRFRPEYRRSCEDLLFWLDFARRTDRFAYSTRVEAHYGRGINVYRSATWGMEGSLESILDRTRCRVAMPGLYPLTDAQRSVVSGRVAELRTEFAAGVLHRLHHRKHLTLAGLWRQFVADPRSLLALVRQSGAYASRWTWAIAAAALASTAQAVRGMARAMTKFSQQWNKRTNGH